MRLQTICILLVSLLLLPLWQLPATGQLASMPSTSSTRPGMPVLSNLRFVPGNRPEEVRGSWEYIGAFEEAFILQYKRHDEPKTAGRVVGVIGADMRAYVVSLPEAQAYDFRLHAAMLRITRQKGPASRPAEASARPDTAADDLALPAAARADGALAPSTPAAPATKPMPAINPALAELLDQVSAALQAADQAYGQAVAAAKQLLRQRMAQARQLTTKPSQQEAIDSTCQQEQTAESPDPTVSEHHVKSPFPAVVTEPPPLGPADARAALLSYKADLELAQHRWRQALAPTTQPALRILREEVARARRRGNQPLADKLNALTARLEAVEHAAPTIWYRLQAAPADDAEKASPKLMPVAMAIHDVQISRAEIGQQLQGSFIAHTLVAPYKVNPNMFGPGFFLLVYDGDNIIYYAGGGWNGEHAVDDDLTLPFDTHGNALVSAKVRRFVFTKPGTYKMRLVLVNGACFNDVLDAWENEVTVGGPTTQP